MEVRLAVLVVRLQRQQGHLLHGAPLTLHALGKEEDGKEHRKREAHKDGDGKDFHVTATRTQIPKSRSPRFVGSCTDFAAEVPFGASRDYGASQSGTATQVKPRALKVSMMPGNASQVSG